MSSNDIGWQAIDNQFNDTDKGNSLDVPAKSGSKIRRRTRILNRELKRFARLKSYSQYVKIKTNILRNVSEDESTEDEPHSAYSSDSEKSKCREFVSEIIGTSLSTTTRKKNNSKARSNKNVQNSLTPVERKETKPSSRAKRNLTSLLDKQETKSVVADKTRTEENTNHHNGDDNIEISGVPAIDISAGRESANVPTGDSGIDDDSQDNSPPCHQENDGFVKIDNSDQTDLPRVIPAEISTTDDERNEKTQAIEEDEEEMSRSEIEGEREKELSRVIPARNSSTDDERNEGTQPIEENEEEMLQSEIDGERGKDLSRVIPARDSSTDDERIEENQAIEEDEEEILQSGMQDERTQKSQPIIKCTEIVKSKYTIIRDENEEEEEDCSERNSQDRQIVQEIRESMDSDRMSPEAERVAKLKRINLLCSGSDSDWSEDDNNGGNISVPLLHGMSSQMISDLSDSDDFSSSSSIHITDSDDPQTPEILDRREGAMNISKNLKNEQSTIKSIKDQIEQQDIFNLSQNYAEEKERDEDGGNEEAEKDGEELEEEDEEPAHDRSNEEVEGTKNKSFKINGESTGTKIKPSTSLKYVLKNLSKRKLCDEEHSSRADNVEGRDTSGIGSREEENLSRPFELRDFVASEGLMPAYELSTISTKDISTTLEDENDDEDVWLMEIPQSIITDPKLCGRKMVIEKKTMRIGEDSYITTLRHDISFSCVLRSKKQKARYKTVNIRPVCSIRVRHLPVKKEPPLIAETAHSPKSVPFPKNVKSRNPLMAEKGSETPQLKKNRTNVEQDKSRQKKMAKRQKGTWHIDRFVLKPKKKKNDIP